MQRVLLLALIVCALFAALSFYRQLPVPQFDFTFGIFQPAVRDQSLVLFTGDVFLGRAVERWLLSDNQRGVFVKSAPLLRAYPEVVINFEAAIPPMHQPTPDFGMQFSVSAELLGRLPSYVSAASLANNHSFDFGLDGYHNTVGALSEQGISPFGHPHTASSTVYVTATEPRVAVVGLNQLGTVFSTEELTTLYQSAAKQADIVVAYVHWGNEYTIELTPAQQTLATELATIGYDIVIGHHPHVIQPVRRIGDTLVLYSLGNTVFDQYFSEAVQTGLLVGLAVSDGQLGLTLYPISSVGSVHQPVVLGGTARASALEALATMSAPMLLTDIKNGFIPLP
jgi:poly-gamma-glutamate synthesis protein (capsule biosynthesis protein)